MVLSGAKLNSVYKIAEVKDGRLTRRLLDMGFTPRCKIKALGFAPFGGTVLVELRGFTVALRKSAAEYIVIEAD